MSFLIAIILNSVSYSWLASISFSILSEGSSFPLDLGLFLCLPTVYGTLLVCLCFLNLPVLSFWLCGVNFYGGRPVRYGGAVSLITWTWCSCDALYAFYVCSLDVIGFWLLLGLSFVLPSLLLVGWGPLNPPCPVCCCARAARTKPQSPGDKPAPTNTTPPTTPLSTANKPALIKV